MQISQKQLKSLGINLDVGRYTKKTLKDKSEIYKCGGDSEGCILVGLGRTATGVGKSRDAMNLIMPLIDGALKRGEKVVLEII